MKLLRYNQEPVEFTVDELIKIDVSGSLLNVLVRRDDRLKLLVGYHIKNY